jgi:hypothetical protein
MNIFAGTGIKHFPVQHSALERLQLCDRPIVKLSATKLYLWLCSKSINGVVEAKANTIKRYTGIDEDTVKSAREELVRLNLITADRDLGQGATFCYTVLNLETGKAFRASEHSGPRGYFQVPRLYVLSKTYPVQSGATVLVYLTVLAHGNRFNTPKLGFDKAKLAAISKLTQKTVSKALVPLTSGDLAFLKVDTGYVEILNPETGTAITAAKADTNGFHFVRAQTGTRVNIKQLLTPENFKRYFPGELQDLNPAVTQQDVCCPFHADSRPSLSVNLEEGVWYCHVCQPENSGMLAFEMKKLNTDDKHLGWKSICNKLGVQLVPRKPGAFTHDHAYTDVDGEVLYAFRRFEDGTGRFFTPTISGKWKPGLNGVKRVPYHLPDLVKADVVIITEGEKKADAVRLLGLHDANGRSVAVTCTGGADSWGAEYVEYFRGKRVILFPDTDEAGQRYAEAVNASFAHAGIDHRTIDFEPFGNDVRDFLQGRTAAELVEYAKCEWLAAPTRPGVRATSYSSAEQAANRHPAESTVLGN